MNLSALQAVLGTHCALCNVMAEHLGSQHLAVAQHALLCIAQHQLDSDANARLAARILRKLDMGCVTMESVTA